MPELPEVENARRSLLQAGLPGRTFTGSQIGWAKTVQRIGVEDFVLGLHGQQVQDVARRGKYILVPLFKGDDQNNQTLIIHLGMTGGLFVQPDAQAPHPMVRHIFQLDDGRQMRFVDGRKFGKLWLADNPANVLPSLGPEPLGDSFTTEALALGLGHRSAPVKALLLEQSIVPGMGNLYADESLFLAGINPMRPASSLTEQELSRLRDCIVAALTYGVAVYDEKRAASWPDPPRALTAWTIPRSPKQSCPRCGHPMEGTRVRGRGTYFCPSCQG